MDKLKPDEKQLLKHFRATPETLKPITLRCALSNSRLGERLSELFALGGSKCQH